MATVINVQHDAQEAIRAHLLKRTPYRTPGIHISDVIGSLVQHVPSLAKSINTDDETRDAMFAAGLGWEDCVVDHVGWGPMSIIKDDITLSIDAFDPTEPRVHEAKFTWKSIRTMVILDQWRWLTQVKGYCFGTQTTEASLWACHVNGEYPLGAPSPVVVEYRLSFNRQELQENWYMLLQHRKLMIEEGWPVE